MNTAKKLMLGLLRGSGAAFLPIDLDFSTLPDGALPALLAGSTWAIVSGRAVNTPTLGPNLLTDPGLEATYTAGKCNTLSKTGSPTLNQSADVHEGAKAQEFAGVANANAVYFAAAAAVAGQWKQFGAWGKRTAGTADDVHLHVYVADALPIDDISLPITSATYVRILVSHIVPAANNQFRNIARQFSAANPSDTVIVDDAANNAIDYTSLFALWPAGGADVVAKMQPDTLIDGTLFGLVLRADAVTAPNNCIFVLAYQSEISTIIKISVIKKVGSTYTRILNNTTRTKVADAWLEVRASGSTVSVWYNNLQVGVNLTVSDAELYGTQHGMFSSGGNQVKAFLASAN